MVYAKPTWDGAKEKTNAGSPTGGGSTAYTTISSASKLWMGGKEQTVGYALNRPFGGDWTKEQMERVYQQASIYAGKEIRDPVSLRAVWKKAVEAAAVAFQASGGKLKMTPAMVLDQMAETTLATKKAGGGGAGTNTSVSKSVDEITEGGAYRVLDDALKNAMGRAPTDSELRRFLGKAHDMARRNPSITRKTVTVDGEGNRRSSSKSTGGMTGDDYALEAQRMAATPEAAAFQVASTYFQALQQALESTVNL